jgi:hypothetical protein
MRSGIGKEAVNGVGHELRSITRQWVFDPQYSKETPRKPNVFNGSRWDVVRGAEFRATGFMQVGRGTG